MMELVNKDILQLPGQGLFPKAASGPPGGGGGGVPAQPPAGKALVDKDILQTPPRVQGRARAPNHACKPLKH